MWNNLNDIKKTVTVASYNQGDSRFAVENRGTQCVAMSAMYFFYSTLYTSRILKRNHLNQILDLGDYLYSQIRVIIPNALLMPVEIPTSVTVFQQLCSLNLTSSVVGILDDDIRCLCNGFLQAFTKGNQIFLIIDGSCIGIRCEQGLYYVFDSHSRNTRGFISSEGTAVHISFTTFSDMVKHVYKLYHVLSVGKQFDMTSCIATRLGLNAVDIPLLADLTTLGSRREVPVYFAKTDSMLSTTKRGYLSGNVSSNVSKSLNKSRTFCKDATMQNKNAPVIDLTKDVSNSNNEEQEGSDIEIIESECAESNVCNQNTPSLKRNTENGENNDSQKKKRKRHKQSEKEKTVNNDQDLQYQYTDELISDNPDVKLFRDLSLGGPSYSCVLCHQLHFKKSVVKLTDFLWRRARKFVNHSLLTDDVMYLCITCNTALRQNRFPTICPQNGFIIVDLPRELDISSYEERLIALRIPFMQIRCLPKGKQYALHGSVINVPVKMTETINMLPRYLNAEGTVAVKLKRQINSKNVYSSQNIRPLLVLQALYWLLNHSPLYREADLRVDYAWLNQTIMELHEIPEVERRENDENDLVSDGCEDNVGKRLEEQSIDLQEKGERNFQIAESNTGKQNEESDDDNFSECGDPQNAPERQTLLEGPTPEYCVEVAPGENSVPLHMLVDINCEYLAFPTLYGGQNPYLNKKNVSYSNICKFELRNVNRRIATNITNIFFKYKKTQLKYMHRMMDFAVRATKNNKNYTAKDVSRYEDREKISQLDHGYFLYGSLRNSPVYLEKSKKEVLAMIRQLGIPTFFMSLSAADLKWVDLLKTLGKLIDRYDYSDIEIENMSWSDRTRLVQSDPVTCARHFNNRFVTFFKQSVMWQITNFGRSY